MTSLESFYKWIDGQLAIARAVKADSHSWEQEFFEEDDSGPCVPYASEHVWDTAGSIASCRDPKIAKHIAANDPDSTIRMLEAFRKCVQALEVVAKGHTIHVFNKHDLKNGDSAIMYCPKSEILVTPETECARAALADIAELAL